MNRILVIEDEPGIALALEDSLQFEGHEVEVVSNGVAGGERATDGRFDLILLDVMLPGKDGFTICNELRRAGVKTPVILITARGQEVDRVRGLDLGANDYVVKPFSSSELMARVRRLLREQENSRQDHKDFEDEIQAAAAVQRGLFPHCRPPAAALQYAASCRPAKGVSGDYHDFIPLNGGKLGLMVADVSGKGLAAAMLGASLQAAVRAFAPSMSMRCGDVLRRVNRLLFETTAPERYATVFYAVYDPVTQLLSYANAGHYPPWLVRGTLITRLESMTAPVGLFAEIAPTENHVQLSPGDWLVVTTDGIPEACDSAGNEFGDERLLNLLKPTCPPDTFCRSAIDAAVMHGRPNQADDLTVLAAQVLAKSSEPIARTRPGTDHVR